MNLVYFYTDYWNNKTNISTKTGYIGAEFENYFMKLNKATLLLLNSMLGTDQRHYVEFDMLQTVSVLTESVLWIWSKDEQRGRNEHVT